MLKQFSIIFLYLLSPILLLAQESKLQKHINFEVEERSLEKTLINLQDKSGLMFSYNPETVPLKELINYSAIDESVEDILKGILEPLDLEYQLVSKQLVIRPKKIRSIYIEGMVINRVSKRPIGGVSISELSTKSTTSSTRSGRYALKIMEPDEKLYLLIRKKGFEDQRLVLDAKTNYDVEISLLEQVSEMRFVPFKGDDEEVYASVDERPFVKAIIPEKVIATSELEDTAKIDPAIQLGIFPPLSTNRFGSGAATNNLSLNLLVGYNEALNGIELGGLINVLRKDMTGLQAAGIGNITGGTARGVQAGGIFNSTQQRFQGIQSAGIFNNTKSGFQGIQESGFINLNRDTMWGIQVAGFSNISVSKDTNLRAYGIQGAGFSNIMRNPFIGVQAAGFNNVLSEASYGIQAAGFLNTVADDFGGLQLSGFQNTTTGKFSGIQSAGFINVAAENMNGIQAAGFINTCGRSVNGIQAAGFINISDDVNGLQVAGFFNRAKVVRGVQIAFINRAEEVKGVSFGFLNLIKKGYKRFEASYQDGDYWAFNYKTGSRWFYNIFHYGTRSNQYSGFGYGFGFQPMVSDRWAMNVDLTARAYRLYGNNFPSDLHNVGRIDLSYRVYKWIEVFAGASYNVYLDTQESITDAGELNPAEVIVRNPMITINRGGGINQVHQWLGYQAGIRLGR